MVTHKNQHYVPQHYLRHFSHDGSGLYRYFLKDGTIRRSSIEKTCAHFWFYVGKEISADFEAALSKIEGTHAAIIQEILDTHSLNVVSPRNEDRKESSMSFLFLCNFILLTATRTKLSKDEGEAAINLAFDLLKQNLAQSREAKELGLTQESIDRVRLRRDTANLEGMIAAMVGPSTISDLAIVLLANETDRPFATSDAPVVFFNFLKLDDLSLLGWQCPGLMIFVPLSEKCALWLFDAEMYRQKPSVTAHDYLPLRRRADVDELNRLQILNADEYVILSKPNYHDYILSLHTPLHRRHREQLITMKKQSEFDVGKERHEIFATGRVAINYTPHLSFLKKDQSYVKAFVERYDEAYKENSAKFGYNKPFVPVRNKAISASFHADMERVRENKFESNE